VPAVPLGCPCPLARRDAAEWDFILRVHNAIAEAIIGGDSGAARHHMAAHFDSAMHRLARGQEQEDTTP
jgi:DNA-binding FadR family transcriptional regulator